MYIVGFEVVAAVVMKSYILRDIVPCSPLKINRRFRGFSFCEDTNQENGMKQLENGALLP
jgi:hypothetical protein